MDIVAERSFSSMVRDIGGNIDRIVRAELQYAVAALKDGIEAAAEASRHIIAAAACATLAAGFALLGGMLALSTLMPSWLASLVIAAVAATAAALLFAIGRARLARQGLPSSRETGRRVAVTR